MTTTNREVPAAIIVAMLSLFLACSDEDTPSGPQDTTPPTIMAVTPVDEFHCNISFSEALSQSAAEDPGHYLVTEVQGSDAVDTLTAASIVLLADGKTVGINTESSMAALELAVAVHGVTDAQGNPVKGTATESFTGSNVADTTPPTIVRRTPAPGSTIGLMETVTVEFSEAVYADFDHYTDFGISSMGIVRAGGATYALTPYIPLFPNSVYTLQVVRAQDLQGNEMVSPPWTLITAKSEDEAPPVITSVTPADQSVNVAGNSDITITFTEPPLQDYFEYTMQPFPNSGVSRQWSSDGKQLVLHPRELLQSNKQYTVTIFGMIDASRNSMPGVFSTIFSTGPALASGTIAGTILGDAGTGANDPQGATVLVSKGSFTGGAFEYQLVGSTMVSGDGYSFPHMLDDKYFLLAMLDVNHDNIFSPLYGDAIGGYGMNFDVGDAVGDSVVIAGGSNATINFPLYDVSAITGTITYSGAFDTQYSEVYAGLFNPATYHPDEPGAPVVTESVSHPGNWPANRRWNVSSFDTPIPYGTYYVGVYLDVNHDRVYDPDTEPLGFYGGSASPKSVYVANGKDYLNLVIAIHDPVALAPIVSTNWKAAPPNPRADRLCSAVEPIMPQR